MSGDGAKIESVYESPIVPTGHQRIEDLKIDYSEIEKILGVGMEFNRDHGGVFSQELNRSGLPIELINNMTIFLNNSGGRFRQDQYKARRMRIEERKKLREKGIDVELVTHFFDANGNELGIFAGPDYDNYNPGYKYDHIEQKIRVSPFRIDSL